MSDTDRSHDVCAFLVKSVVSKPDQVEVKVDGPNNGKVALEVHVADGDMGRVIGKRGRVANAIRTVVSAAASADDLQAEVEFAD